MLPTSASMLHTVWGELLHPIISYRSLAEEFHRYFQLIYIYFLISPSQKTFILPFRPSTLKFLSAPRKGISFTLSAVKLKGTTILSLSFIRTETWRRHFLISSSSILSLVNTSSLFTTALQPFLVSADQYSYISPRHPYNCSKQRCSNISFLQQFLVFHQDNPAQSNSNYNYFCCRNLSFLSCKTSSTVTTTFLSFTPSTKTTTFPSFIPSTIHHSYLLSGQSRSNQQHFKLSLHQQSNYLVFCQDILAQSNSIPKFLSLNISSISSFVTSSFLKTAYQLFFPSALQHFCLSSEHPCSNCLRSGVSTFLSISSFLLFIKTTGTLLKTTTILSSCLSAVHHSYLLSGHSPSMQVMQQHLKHTFTQQFNFRIFR